MAEAKTDSLITVNEAEELNRLQNAPMVVLRTPLLVASSALVITLATLGILVILSVRGVHTGVESVLPFLDKQPVENLQLPQG